MVVLVEYVFLLFRSRKEISHSNPLVNGPAKAITAEVNGDAPVILTYPGTNTRNGELMSFRTMPMPSPM